MSDVAIATDGTCLYWSTTDQAPGWILNGPDAGPLLAGGGTFDPGTTVTSLAVDASGIYWTENSSFGTVVFQPATNCYLTGQRVALAQGASFPFAVAVDDTYVYWINAGVSYSVAGYGPTSPASCTGSVQKVAK